MNIITSSEERDEETSFGYCNDYQPHAVKRMFDYKNEMLYDMQWDGAGNLNQISYVDRFGLFNSTRHLAWTEDSRLYTVADERYYSYYAYDHTGQRTLKMTGDASTVDVNAWEQHSYGCLDHVTLYPSPYMVLTEQGYTKHYYAGTERVAARIGSGGLSYDTTCVTGNGEVAKRSDELFWEGLKALNEHKAKPEDFAGMSLVDAKGKEVDWLKKIDLDKLAMSWQLEAKLDPWKIHFVIDDNSYPAMPGNTRYENEPDVYFYHSDHLGSASWITDFSGMAVQHIQYLPYGEPYINQRPFGYSERFTFTGKERDEETGYGYFGARYMDHELMTMWLSVDPMADKYPNISPYAYCIWNPIVLIDPDGNEGIVVSGGEYDGDRYKYNFIEPAITKLKALKAAAGNEPITWVVMTAGYSESDMASFQKIARDLGVGFQAISSADEFTNYLNAKSIGSAELSEARRNDPITSISVFGHGYAGSAEFAHNQPGQGRFSWGTGNVKQLDAGAFKNATVDFYTCNSATDPEKGKSLGYVFSQQTGAVVTGYRGKSTYAKMNVGEGIGAKWDRLWEGFNPNGSVRLPQAGEGAIRIKFLPPVMNGNQ